MFELPTACSGLLVWVLRVVFLCSFVFVGVWSFGWRFVCVLGVAFRLGLVACWFTSIFA